MQQLIPWFTGLLLISFSVSLQAEDWTTVDGKTYSGVIVVKVEADAVTILYSDGGALIPLSKLPSNLQQKFHYDPVKAQSAANQRNSDQKASIQAEIQEKDALKAKYVAEARQSDQASQDRARLQQMIQNPVYIHGTVLQKTDGGIIVKCDVPEVVRGLGGIYSSDESTSPPGTKRIFGTFFLTHLSNESSLVDGDSVIITAYPTGPYSYVTVQGSQATIASYTAVLPRACGHSFEP